MSVLEPEAARARLAQTDITGHELAEIATRHPSLRVLVAAHPNTYPDLLTWLGTLGDPAVNAVLAARTTPSSPAAPPPPPAAAPPVRTPSLGHAHPDVPSPTPAQPDVAVSATAAPQVEPPAPPPARRRTGLWIAIGTATVMVIAAAITITLLNRDTSADLTEPTPISTVFPDPGLAQCIADALGVSIDTLVTQDDLDALNDHDAHDLFNDYYPGGIGLPPIDSNALECYGITDLTGIGFLTNLQILYLGSTYVTDISPLADLANLQFLYLRYMPVTDVSPLAGLTDLRYLSLNGTYVPDISPLDHLVADGLQIGW